MKRTLYLGAMIAVMAAGFCVGAWWGFRRGEFQAALAENKVAVLNLDSSPTLDAQFREYLKARIYSNIRQFYPAERGYLQRKDWDRGPVNKDLLGQVQAVKDPTAAVSEWETAVVQKLPWR